VAGEKSTDTGLRDRAVPRCHPAGGIAKIDVCLFFCIGYFNVADNGCSHIRGLRSSGAR
jgi:hypothetical protein